MTRLRILACLLACALLAAPAAAQWCDFDVSVYADGAAGSYDANGNAELFYWGSGYDYSDCAFACGHGYALSVQVERQPEQTVVATMQGTNDVYSSVTVTPAVYGVYVQFLVWCWCEGDWMPAALADMQVQVPPPPQLRLYLDAEPFSFTTSNPQSDHEEYVPGSLLNGSSVPVSTILGAGQEVRLIAAFVNQSGQIVAPPSGVTQVQFSLHETSAFQGYAMNASFGDGRDTADDFVLEATSASFQGDQTARVVLRARDYGGFTTVRATASSQQVEFRVPKDDDNNWLPDGGWWSWAGPNKIDDTFGPGLCSSVASCDSDTVPEVPGGSLPARGRTGDGLTHFEEFRGFIVRGEHRRTNPNHKDLFVSSTLDVGISMPSQHYQRRRTGSGTECSIRRTSTTPPRAS